MPISDELLLQLRAIGADDVANALSGAAKELEALTQAERDFTKANSDLEKSSDEAANGFSKMQAGIVTLESGVRLAEQGVELFKKAWDFAKEGAAIERIQTQFDNLAKSAGVNASKLLDGLNKAAHGTVDDEQLMQTATRAMALGISNNVDDLVKLMEIARASSVTFGGDTASAFERISTAVENLTPRALKQSGIIVNLNKAYADYAASVNKSADSLTDEEKRQALLNQVLEKGQDLVTKLGDAGDDAATKFARFDTRLKDLGDRLKSAAADVFLPVLNRMDAMAILSDENATSENKLAAAILVNQDALSGLTNKLGDYIEKLKVQIALEKELGMTSQESALRTNMAKMQAFTPSTFNPQAATDLTTLTPAEQKAAAKAYTDFQAKLTDIEKKGDEERVKVVSDTMDALDKLEADSGQKRQDIIDKFTTDEANRLSDMRDKRIDILTSYSEAEQQITDQQNKSRLQLARNYGVEAERAEEDHQIAMQRMTEDHTRRLSRLADSRDALGIEDEQANYELEARRAEQDYQTTAQRRSEDYAQQLADLNAAAEEQRQARAREKDKQLAELNAQFIKQDERYKAAYDKQLTDLDKQTEATRQEIWKAEGKKIDDLRIKQDEERAQANQQWTQWRNEHDIFFAGERAAYDAYLKYTYDQLVAYTNSGGASTTPMTTPVHAPGGGRALGGSVDPFQTYIVGEHGPERLHMGNRGGYVSPNGGNIFKVDIQIGGTNATTNEIEEAVYRGITKVMQAAMQ